MITIQHSLLAAGLLAASTASAITIDTVLVGNAGNANDSTGYGGVGYNYHIGTYEVTNGQYTAFLNAKAATDPHSLYNSSMEFGPSGGITRGGSEGSYTYSVMSGFANKPVNNVSFWDAARFTNWMTNGQGSGSTETGVYLLTADGITNNTITRDLTYGSGSLTEVWAITSENEWYKAAYYDGNGGYNLYPTQSDTISTDDANYNNSLATVTDVGTYAADPSHYGTFDQGGNVWELNDTIVNTTNRGMRGGSLTTPDSTLQSSFGGNTNPTDEIFFIGFRVSSLAPIPEPAAYAAILGCLGLTLAMVRRKGRTAN